MVPKTVSILLVTLITITFLVSTTTSGQAASAARMTNHQSDNSSRQTPTYSLVDTGQGLCYNNNSSVACPADNVAFYGQDAQYSGMQPGYTDNGDGTVTDNVTGLMWQQSPDINSDGTINAADKLSYSEALTRVSTFNLAGYTDWRLPTIKELYSLILFDGTDPSGLSSESTVTLVPFIDLTAFDFAYGDSAAGERTIDAQFATSTLYVSTTNGEAMFGVNFADGRIKGYGTGPMPGQSQDKGFFVLYVRGNPLYGQNDFVDNGDSTIIDRATGLMWQQFDSATGMNWSDALAYCENLNAAGYDDWRLPNVKELPSIVDYSRSPDTTNSAAIDPLFSTTTITNEAGQIDYPAYWSSTTHANFANGGNAAYVAFGRALGYMNNAWIDIHGAGAQRSDPKKGNPADWPNGHGPQGDAIRIMNYARCVRGGNVTSDPGGSPNSTRTGITITATSTDMMPGGMAGGQPQAGGTPPQEAINACSGASQDATCQFTTPQGTVTGTCMSIAGQFACVPVGGPPGAN
jgi:hypothetical protein